MFLHFQRAGVERAKLEQELRVRNLELQMHKAIETLLIEAREAQKVSDSQRLEAALRRILLLDTKKEFSREVLPLKSQLLKLEQHNQEVQRLQLQMQQNIAAERLDEASLTLEQLKAICANITAYERELTAAREHQLLREDTLSRFEKALDIWALDDALIASNELKGMCLSEASQQLLVMQSRLTDARSLDERARQQAETLSQLDSAEYSAELIQQVAESLLNFPAHPALLALQVRLISYPQTVRVPGDVASLEDALEILRAGDILLLGEGVFYAELMITKPIAIRGAGIGKTIIESETRSGPALFFQHEKGQSILAGVELKGDRDSLNTHSLIVVKGANLSISGCRVSSSAGHGIAVLAGDVDLVDCVISDNAWDGISAHGCQSQVSLKSSKFSFNGEHGMDFWNGAKGVIVKCEATENSKTGVVAVGAGTRLRGLSLQSSSNREAGFYVSAQATALYQSARAHGNSFSGFVLDGENSRLELKSSVSSGNFEFGYFIDPRSSFIHTPPLAGEGNLMGVKQLKNGQ